MAGSEAPRRTSLHLVTDQRQDFFNQVPTVRVHSAVRQVLGVPNNTLIRVRDNTTARATAAWLVSSDAEGDWRDCATPWHRSVQLSAAAWRLLAGDDSVPRSGRLVEITVPGRRMPIRPSRGVNIHAGHEVGLHRDDARRMRISRWAQVNHRGIPGHFRVRLSDREEDRGIVRLSYQARVLLGVRARRHGLLPELIIEDTAAYGRLPMDEPTFEGPRSGRWRRWVRWPGGILERALASALRAPEFALLTTDAQPGEDQMLTARIPAGLFPMLGTYAGQQVYISWGAGNRVVATALAEENEFRGVFADTDIVGVRVRRERPPSVAMVRIGAESRVALGIPRATIVTVRRRVTSLILGRLNELILPVTGLFLAAAANVKLLQWRLVPAGILILALLLAPLRVRRNPRGRVP